MTKATAPAPIGMTIQVAVPAADMQSGREYYTALFGRPPVFEAHDDFIEWPPIDGQECWLQLVGSPNFQPLWNRIRLRVADLHAAVDFLAGQNIEHSQPQYLPGVVGFLDFNDPWGNRLGYYQDLVPTEQQQSRPGSSVTDQSQFQPFN